jgi:hypothetical protein
MHRITTPLTVKACQSSRPWEHETWKTPIHRGARHTDSHYNRPHLSGTQVRFPVELLVLAHKLEHPVDRSVIP